MKWTLHDFTKTFYFNQAKSDSGSSYKHLVFAQQMTLKKVLSKHTWMLRQTSLSRRTLRSPWTLELEMIRSLGELDFSISIQHLFTNETGCSITHVDCKACTLFM